MTVSEGPDFDIHGEVDVASVDPLFLERQRNWYAHRGLAMIVLLNGLAAIALLVTLSTVAHHADSADRFGEAMIVFGAGAAAGLASAFFAYLSRTFRLERRGRGTWRRPLRWLAVAAAITSAVCFVSGLNMARIAGKEAAEPASGAQKAGEQAPRSPAPARPNP
jgi:hypothetical protein